TKTIRKTIFSFIENPSNSLLFVKSLPIDAKI
ncbi:MAG: hypothetical protein ACI88H_003654, partial [Cocleimonas sp.]